MTTSSIHSLADLPSLTRKERDAGHTLRDRLLHYPYAAKTPLALPLPADVNRALDGEFFRQPYPRAREAVWLFETDDQREEFLDLYVGEKLDVAEPVAA